MDGTLSQRTASEIGGLRSRVRVAAGAFARTRRVVCLLTLATCLGVGCSARDGGDAASSKSAAAGSEAEGAAAAHAPFEWPTGPHPVAQLVVAGLGEIEIELYPELAPATVANFERLANEGFYDGTSFHRVIPGFMLQGGDPNSKDANPRNDGTGGPGYTIDDELSEAPHVRGVLSMANTGRPNTGGSQFFIVLEPQPHLDGRHTVFGRVVDGFEVVDAIARVDTDTHGRFGPKDRPIDPVVVERVSIEVPVAGAAYGDASAGAHASR